MKLWFEHFKGNGWFPDQPIGTYNPGMFWFKSRIYLLGLLILVDCRLLEKMWFNFLQIYRVGLMTSNQYGALSSKFKNILDLYQLVGWILLLWYLRWLLIDTQNLKSWIKDSFRKRERVQPVHSEIALVSYCSESEYIKQKQETIVYDYQVLTLMYILFQLTHFMAGSIIKASL